jgi:hypothetical protein
MKKHFLSFALITAIVASVAAGCSSEKAAGTSDTTMKDSASMSAPMSDTTARDTARTDTAATRDTTKTP